MIDIGARISELRVDKDLTGGVRVTLGGSLTILSPADAIKFGSAILKAAGCNINFDGDMKTKKALFGRRL